MTAAYETAEWLMQNKYCLSTISITSYYTGMVILPKGRDLTKKPLTLSH